MNVNMKMHVYAHVISTSAQQIDAPMVEDNKRFAISAYSLLKLEGDTFIALSDLAGL